MGKTFRRDQQHRPKKNGKSFTKDKKQWKKDKRHPDNENIDNIIIDSNKYEV